MKKTHIIIALVVAWALCFGFLLPALISAKSTFIVLLGISVFIGLITATYYGVLAISESK